MTQEQWSPDFGDIQRKEDQRERLLAFVRGEEGDYRKSTENSVVADNETSWEIGAFSDPRPTADAYRDDLIIRARRDAFAAKLNSIDILDTVGRLELAIQSSDKRISELKLMVSAALAVSTLLLVITLFGRT